MADEQVDNQPDKPSVNADIEIARFAGPKLPSSW